MNKYDDDSTMMDEAVSTAHDHDYTIADDGTPQDDAFWSGSTTSQDDEEEGGSEAEEEAA